MNFSIIVPSYNQARFLPKTLSSILKQSDLKECLVYDGGSSDDTVNILKKSKRKYSKLWFQSKKDGGQSSAINLGLSKARGDIVAYINSDDYYLPHSFRTVSDYFTSNPNAQWLVGNCQVSSPSLSWTFKLKQLVPYNHFPFLIQFFNPINQPSVFIRRSFIKKVGKFNTSLHYAFDYDYWLRASKLSAPHRIMKDLALFRVHPESKGNRGYQKQFSEDFRVITKYTKNKLVLSTHFIFWKMTLLGYKILKSDKSHRKQDIY